MPRVSVAWSWLLIVWVSAGGCVYREIEIMSRPPGATVEFDGEMLPQTTPVRFPFDWYGTHEIVVERPGYIRERMFVHITPPWYEQFPLDLFTELLWPGWLYDVRSYPLALEKMMPSDDVPDDERSAMKTGLIERGEQFRDMAREALGLPPVEPKGEPAPAPPGEGAATPEKKPEPPRTETPK